MPPAHQPPASCPHSKILYTPSPHAAEVGYTQPALKARQDAMRPAPVSSSSSRKQKSRPITLRPDQLRTDLTNFPAPLILPDDDLALDPGYPPQSFREWVGEEERNAVTGGRRTVYVLGAPGVDPAFGSLRAGGVDVEAWTRPRRTDASSESSMNAFPEVEDVVGYLAAFYNGLPVKQLTLANWKFTSWDEPVPATAPTKRKKPSRKPQPISLVTPTEQIRIRTRPCPDGAYTTQLNLDDLLDAAISVLPKDAYALCMLVHHDLFEDDDDTFVCGRAYGGSCVAVVSTARYHPGLDVVLGVEGGHAWPAAHCAAYVEGLYRGVGGARKRRKGGEVSKSQSRSSQDHKARDGPLEAALAAYNETNPTRTKPDPESETPLWLWRTARTISHELGHCFGIDHCVYYACIMQGSASLAEDTRQPPYLCPVDLAKVLAATGASVAERDQALLRFCERADLRGEGGFQAYAAWLRGSLRLQGLEDEAGGDGDVGGKDGASGVKEDEKKKVASESGLITESWKRLWDDLDK
ncbi:hypothetical protein BJY00DRAFT_282665 [Aspergillus carlsbadensis]|nr:hypothetical protein BJY00DRAFT_282665 [Aspergillus carlsbadensis]